MKTSTTNKQNLVEVARSFSYKLNLGNYQTVDFFCSQKAEVPENEAEQKSEQLYLFCRLEVQKSITAFLKEQKEETERKLKKATLEIQKSAVELGEEFNKRMEREGRLDEERVNTN